jgi:thiamine kinase-like enzyme
MDDSTLSGNADGSQAPRDDLGQIVPRLIPLLGQIAGTAEPLSGGITNRNYRATLGGTDYVIRVPGKDTSLLGIDRAAEFAANAAAAKIGVAAPVAAMLTDPPAIVTNFIEGREMDAAELRESRPLCNVADALRLMHAAPAIPSRFDSFRIVEDYERVARDLGVTVPPDYADAHASAARIEAVLAGDEHEPVPCHNDLLAANFIWDGHAVRIVDWEYAGMGDRYFDLANFAVNNELPERARHDMLEHYFRRPPSERQLATLLLFTFMSDFREAMWGVVQQGASDIEFDFAEYTEKHFRRLTETAQAPEFAAALEAARGD